MNTFKWIPEVGDKFTGPCGVVAQAVDGRSLDYNYAIRHLKGSNQPKNKIDRYGGGWPGGLEPLGKRAEASLERQYAKWKQDQNLEEGDYVVCKTSRYGSLQKGGVYQVEGLTREPCSQDEGTSFKLVDNDYYFYNQSSFRKATDEEIAEYKRANKTVWDLEEGELCYVLQSDGRAVRWCWGIGTGERLRKFRRRGLLFLTAQAAKEADNRRIKENKQ